MRKLTLTLSAAALALGGTGVALADHHGGKRGMMGADADNDGVVSLAEAKAHGAQRFAEMDVNGDGVLNEEDRAARRAARFEAADKDGNGELSAEEMAAAREARRAERTERREKRQAKKFERLDTDNSGGVSRSELEAAREARMERGERRKMRHAMRGARRHHAMMMLREADKDGDKTVTRAEFDAAIETHFARIDTDNSGTITAEEHKAARKAMRDRMMEHRGKRHDRGDRPTT